MLTAEEKEIVIYNLQQLKSVLLKARIFKKTFTQLGSYGKFWAWEKGIRTPRKLSIKKICDKFKIDYDVFISKKLELDIVYSINVKIIGE